MINLNYPLLKPVRMLMLPFSLVYGFVIWVRNWMFDRNILRSASFNLPLICIGNLAVGGTGKSPMVEFLIAKLKNQFHIAVLSRGYKRKTTGYALANPQSTALEIGDEPMQFFNKFPDVTVAVGEERVVAIPQLLHDKPDTKVILLDDAFQHRSVKAGFNILLTDYNNLFTRDWFLPTGDLRDQPKSARRANIIIITKCPPDLSLAEKNHLIKEIKPGTGQHVFFTTISYGKPYQIITRDIWTAGKSTEILLVSGIANPATLKKHLEEKFNGYDEIAYSDHHIYTIDDLKNILRKFEQIPSAEKILLTTEKDAVRLQKFSQQLRGLPFFVMPIEPVFLFKEENQFTHLITTFIQDFPDQA
ncbi:MAG TPA: tetraacyldisaccharide 4'-kinase [Puia sp.]|nr:tetraacyldisaccharide 4'-kinase [Puia sp.]